MILLMVWITLPLAFGYAQPAQSGYLTYEDPAGQEESSVGSTVAYLFSLVFVFVFVLGLAYLASRFIAQKSAYLQSGRSAHILDHLQLGANQAVYAVEMAGKVLLLGVTGQQITLLQEITDQNEIEKLHEAGTEAALLPGNMQHLFKSQITSLEKVSRKIPDVFKKDRSKEKR